MSVSCSCCAACIVTFCTVLMYCTLLDVIWNYYYINRHIVAFILHFVWRVLIIVVCAEWIRKLCLSVDDCCLLTGDQPDISSKLCQAMEALQDRPVLFKWDQNSFQNYVASLLFVIITTATATTITITIAILIIIKWILLLLLWLFNAD